MYCVEQKIGKKGAKGIQGIIGPTGPSGQSNTDVVILGQNYSGYSSDGSFNDFIVMAQAINGVNFGYAIPSIYPSKSIVGFKLTYETEQEIDFVLTVRDEDASENIIFANVSSSTGVQTFFTDDILHIPITNSLLSIIIEFNEGLEMRVYSSSLYIQ